MSRRVACWAAVVALLLAGGADAVAQKQKWPRPAAGPSASGDPEVVFTFDDGPDERTTPVILDILAQHRIQAIFFWVGRRIRGKDDNPLVAKRRAVVERAVRAGHLIGNHTVTHAQLCAGDLAAAEREIDQNQAMFAALTRLPSFLFRAPYGASCGRVKTMLGARGLTHFHWDIDPQEFLGKDADQVAALVIGQLRHLEGRAVILMHDTKRVTVKALPQILAWIDAENARRRQQGGRPIRIVSGSEVMAERLDPGLVAWGRQSAAALRADLVGTLGRLLPAAPPAPAARDSLRSVTQRPARRAGP